MILAIDPSFSSSGVVILSDSLEVVEFYPIHMGGKCYTSPASCDDACRRISDSLRTLLFKYKDSINGVIIEFPAPSRSGFYLAILHGWLMSTLSILDVPIIVVPCMACDSFISNKKHSKSYIVDYCKQNNWVPEKRRINNDLCTAVVLGHLFKAIIEGTYKHSWSVFRINH